MPLTLSRPEFYYPARHSRQQWQVTNQPSKQATAKAQQSRPTTTNNNSLVNKELVDAWRAFFFFSFPTVCPQPLTSLHWTGPSFPVLLPIFPLLGTDGGHGQAELGGVPSCRVHSTPGWRSPGVQDPSFRPCPSYSAGGSRTQHKVGKSSKYTIEQISRRKKKDIQHRGFAGRHRPNY